MLFVLLGVLATAVSEPETYVLDNGLTVILDRQSTVPAVHMCVEYEAGWADDPADAVGLNVLAYALMSRPLPNLGDRAPVDVLHAHGIATRKVEQFEDFTQFCSEMTPQELEAALWVESHRAMALAEPIKDDTLAKTRTFALMVPPDGAFTSTFRGASRHNIALWNRMFPEGNRYVIKKRMPAALTEERVHELAPLYSASNAVLILVGELPGNVKSLIKKHWAGAPAHPRRAAVPQTPDGRIAFSGRGSFTAVWSFDAQPVEREVGDVVAALLTNENARLRAESDDFRHSLIFRVDVGESDGQEPRTLLREWIERVRDSVTDADVAAAVKNASFDRLAREQTHEWRAYANRWFYALHGEAFSPARAAARFTASRDDVVRFINAHLAEVPEPVANPNGQMAQR